MGLPFDQIFRFEIPSIWNKYSIFRFVRLTRPRPSDYKFRPKIRNQTEDCLPTLPFLLALGLLDDSEIEINDELDEDNNKTFIVGISKSSAGLH